MAQVTVKYASEKKWTARHILRYVLPAVIPAILLVLYYFYSGNQDVMDWVNAAIASPYRDAAAKVSSLGPFRYISVAELLITLLVIWVLIYIVQTIVFLITRPHKFHTLGRRLFTLIVVALYIAAAFTWLWGTGYHSTTLAEKTGLNTKGISIAQLTETTKLFADKANELASEVNRDEHGHFVSATRYYFALSQGVYTNISAEFPALDGTSYLPKAMVYSKLMSQTGFTGVYIALTGETNINVDAPAALIPTTVAHEMAHQHGINSEEEANFAGIAACITSNIPIFEYSGYLSGLIYLANALSSTDPASYAEIMSALNDDVNRDLADNSNFWSQNETPATEAVSAMYDVYLKANGETLGISSYGACVDMLASWLSKAP